MFSRKDVTRFLFLCLLLAMLAVPVVGMAVEIVTADPVHSTLYQTQFPENEPVAIADCNGGSGNNCGGG